MNQLTNHLILRQATHDDAYFLADLFARNFHLACPPNTSAQDMAAHIASDLSPSALAALIADPSLQVWLLEGLAPHQSQVMSNRDFNTTNTLNEALTQLRLSEQNPIAGCIMLCFEPAEGFCPVSATGLEIKRLYVDQRWHGQGVAQRLMQLAEDKAHQQSCQYLCLGTSVDNLRAIAFYQKLGFNKVGTTHFLVGNDLQTDWIMQRKL